MRSRADDSAATNTLPWALREDHVSTFCAFGQGATAPWDMPCGASCASTQGYGVEIAWKWCVALCSRARDRAVTGIRDWGTPAIIGFDFVNAHYALAYGYAEKGSDRWFRCNMGWDGVREWVKARVWFGQRLRLSQ